MKEKTLLLPLSTPALLREFNAIKIGLFDLYRRVQDPLETKTAPNTHECSDQKTEIHCALNLRSREILAEAGSPQSSIWSWLHNRSTSANCGNRGGLPGQIGHIPSALGQHTGAVGTQDSTGRSPREQLTARVNCSRGLGIQELDSEFGVLGAHTTKLPDPIKFAMIYKPCCHYQIYDS